MIECSVFFGVLSLVCSSKENYHSITMVTKILNSKLVSSKLNLTHVHVLNKIVML